MNSELPAVRLAPDGPLRVREDELERWLEGRRIHDPEENL
jgi:hypothetical protein